MDFSAKLVSRVKPAQGRINEAVNGEVFQKPKFKPAKAFEFRRGETTEPLSDPSGAKAERGSRNCGVDFDERSSKEERKGNALASGADEGRDKLR